MTRQRLLVRLATMEETVTKLTDLLDEDGHVRDEYLRKAVAKDYEDILAGLRPLLNQIYTQLGGGTVNGAPVASNVTITGFSGAPQVGQTAGANYLRQDPENDPAGTPIIKFYQADDVAGTGKVVLATSPTYTIASTSIGKRLAVGVTVTSTVGAASGVEVLSAWSSPVVAAPVGGGLIELHLDNKAESKRPGQVTYNGVVFMPGQPYWSGSASNDYTDGGAIAGTNYQAAYQDGRYIPNTDTLTGTGLTPNSTYDAVLGFIAFNANHAFNIEIGGQTVATQINIAQLAGTVANPIIYKAVTLRYPVTTDGSGNAQPIVFTGGVAFCGVAEFLTPGAASPLA